MILENIWVINMDKNPERLEKIKKNFDKLKLKFNRFKAINGKELNKNQIDNITTLLCQNLLCNHGMIGCAQSHKELWKQLINDENTDYYLILEDDSILTNESINIIKKIEPKMLEYSIDLLNLGCIHSGCVIFKTEFKIDNYEFGKPILPLGMIGYIITKKCALKLLNYFDKINYHIDYEILFKHLSNNINYYSSNIPIINTNLNEESTMGGKNKTIILELLNNCGFDYISWNLNAPIFTIKMYYIINLMLIILILLLILNQVKWKSDILFWFIILELFLFNSNYL